MVVQSKAAPVQQTTELSFLQTSSECLHEHAVCSTAVCVCCAVVCDLMGLRLVGAVSVCVSVGVVSACRVSARFCCIHSVVQVS